MSKILLSLLLVSSVFAARAQFTVSHCGSEELRQHMLDRDPAFRKAQEDIEAFTANYVQLMANAKTKVGKVYYIPVVVHVIHNGEALGSGANISVAQITSEIAVLNKDYRMLNTDSLKPTHAYYSVADDAEIEFCLATLDPNGQFTTGIDRFNYSQPSYDYTELETIIKPNTIWKPEQYLNIWVCKLGGSAGSLLGYATPPGTATDNDGVVISTTSFGTVGNVMAPYNKGRTATHEVGHYFNLRHVWGDANCGNDQVSDTQPAKQANYGCPTFPHNANSTCGAGPSGEMYMNYMDYTDDACMKMFTTGQKTRMRATLAAGGSRSTLASSLGCTWPVGLSEQKMDNQLKLFPNPCSTHLYLKSGSASVEKYTIQVFNAFGQDLTSSCAQYQENGTQTVLDTHNLVNGTYFLRIHSASGTILKKITVIQ